MTTKEPSRRLRRARPDRHHNLELVLDAARALFAERGGEVTMEEVARRAGVGVGTIYRRFPSKYHLFAAVSQAVCADTERSLTAAATAAPDPVGKIRALAYVIIQQGKHAAGLLALRPEPATAPHACALAPDARLHAFLLALLQQVIADGQQRGVFRTGDPEVLAALCLELLQPHTCHHLHRMFDDDSAAVAEHLVAFVLAGLGATHE